MIILNILAFRDTRLLHLKLVLLRFKAFHGVHGDLKLYEKSSGLYRIEALSGTRKISTEKNGVVVKIGMRRNNFFHHYVPVNGRIFFVWQIK